MRVSNCKHETSNGRCGLRGCYAYRHKCYTEDLCKCHEPMTNADRIRAMTDEELAELLANETYRIAKPCFDAFGYGLEKQIIYVKRLSWLQQPAEEG